MNGIKVARNLTSIVLMVLFSAAGSAAASPQNATTQAAIQLFQQSLDVGSNGPGDALLRSLRQMRDPALRPFFKQLVASHLDALRIHGMLGLAALSPKHQLDLAQVVTIKSPDALAQLISAALDDHLLPAAQAKQLLAWPGLSRYVKVLLIARRFDTEGRKHLKLLRQAAKSKKIGERSLASLLLYELNDPAGIKGLQALDRSTSSKRDVVRAMLLMTALRQKFHRARQWAYAIATEHGVDPNLQLLAERVAMRFGSRATDNLWARQYAAAAAHPAHQMELAMLVLHLSPWLPASLFKPMLADPDPLVQQIGRTGRAIAQGKANAADQIITLIQQQYPPANQWAYNYASTQAKPSNAQMIYLGLIVAYKQGAAAGRMRRLNTAVQAAQALYEQDPKVATHLLRPVLASPKTDPMLVKGILLALVRTQKPGTVAVIRGLHQFSTLDADDLATLLRAKHAGKMTRSQMRDLSLIVRGGSALEPPLEIQAAWAWLKRTGQSQAVLALLHPNS